jgi:predicted RNA-binding protein with PUA-like domain
MKKGDQGVLHHTGDEKQVVGIAEVIRNPIPTRPTKGVFVTVDVKAVKPLPKPVTLAAVKPSRGSRTWRWSSIRGSPCSR